jgi:4-carboxymuconolactone decarboxylase
MSEQPAFDAFQAADAASWRLGNGLRQIYAFLDADGALPRHEKAVFIAFGHAVLGQTPLLHRALERARDLGTPAAFVARASILLLLNRGETAFRDFTLAARELFDMPAAAAPAEPFEATADEALAYFAEHFGGEVPYRQRLFAELAPAAFAGYQQMHAGALKHNPLGPRTGELLLCTALTAVYEFTLLDVHVSGARTAGASEAEIAEAILCAVPAAGLTAWAGGSGAIVRTRAENRL